MLFPEFRATYFWFPECDFAQDLILVCCFQLWSIQGTKNSIKSSLTGSKMGISPTPLLPQRVVHFAQNVGHAVVSNLTIQFLVALALSIV